MTKEMNREELSFYFDSLGTLELNKSKTFSEKVFDYDAKFYKLPIMK